MEKAILKQHMDEIKALVDYQNVNYSIYPFSIGVGTTTAFNEWWGRFIDSIFNQGARKALSCLKLVETIGIMPITWTISELYQDIIDFEEFYGIHYNTFNKLICKGRWMK